jgi:hypothetical protein
MSKKNKILLNGPINTIRLEGLVNGSKKVIYIFGDIHRDLNNQTECDNLNAEDINKYLYKFIKEYNGDEYYDIFIEANKEYIKKKRPKESYKIKYKYINQLRKLINILNISPNNKKIIINNKFKKFRFHYTDVRYLTENEPKVDNYEVSDYLYHNLPHKIYNIPFYIEKSDVSNIISDYVKILSILKNTQKEIKNNTKIVNKLKNDYKNRIIKNTLNDIFDNLSKFLDNIILEIEKYKYDLNERNNSKKKLTDKDRFNIITKYSHYQIIIKNFYASIHDLYFLRRVLDKSYTKRNILYTGLFHMIHIIIVLVKKFNFKITHVSYSKKSISFLNKSIIKENYSIDKFISSNIIHKYYDFLDSKYQCSDITDFPDNFT